MVFYIDGFTSYLLKMYYYQVFKKLSLGDYNWISFDDVQKISTHFGRGLRELGQQPHTPIAIYAETRAEWIMSAFGAFSQE